MDDVERFLERSDLCVLALVECMKIERAAPDEAVTFVPRLFASIGDPADRH